MIATYQIRVYDTSGALKAVMGLETDVRSIVIEHRVNYASTLQLGLYELAQAVQYFTLDAIVEVRRRVPEADIDWYTEFVGFHRTPQRWITTGDNRIFTSYCRGLIDLLNRRSIRYFADTNGSAKGPAPTDDIMKDFVRENAGSLATIANSRLTDGVTAGLSVAANTSQAASIETAQAWNNLLNVLREIGEPAMVDFDVEWGGGTSPLTFNFVTHYPQLGTDRRPGTANPFTFSPEFSNMENPTFTQQRTDEITSVLVLGPGESVNRDTTLVTSTHTADSPWNLIELDQNASNEDRAAALIDVGEQVLFDKRPAKSFAFQPLQTPKSAYGKDYFLGDIVAAQFSSVSGNVKIRALTVNLDAEGEKITMELEEIPDA